MARKSTCPSPSERNAAGAIDPVLIPAVDAGARVRPELRVLHVEGTDPRVIGVDEGEIVELLQDEVAGIVEQLQRG